MIIKRGEQAKKRYNKDLRDQQTQYRMRGSGDTLPAGLDVNGKSSRINSVCSPTQRFSSHPAVSTHSRIITFLKLIVI